MGASILTVIEPDATLALGAWSVHGAATAHQAVTDISDGSYIEMDVGLSAGQSFYVQFSLSSTAAFPPLSQCKFLQLNVRATQSPTAPLLTLRVDMNTPSGTVPVEFSNINGLSINDYSVAVASRPGGGPWTEDDINNLTLSIVSKTTYPLMFLYKLSVGVWINHAPVVAAASPGTVTTTSMPTLTWTYSDTESDAQEAIEAKIFSGATAVADPDNETARLVSGTGEVFYGGTALRANSLRNGAYRWAIKARDAGAGPDAWGYWSQATFTMNTPAPAPPTLTATPDPTNNRYVLTIGTGGGPNAPETYQVERSNDSGVSWRAVRGCVSIPADGGANPVTVYDYEAPRMASASTIEVVSTVAYNAPIVYNAAVGYNASVVTAATGPPNVVRYRVSASRMFSGEILWSNYTEVMPASLVGNATTWLKHPNPTKNIRIQQLADWESVSEEDIAALRAVGRDDWVVFGDVASLEKGELDIIFPGDVVWEAFEELRSPKDANGIPVGSADSLLLQSCFGDTVLEQMWVRLGPNRSVVRVTHTGQNYQQYRRVKVGFFQTLRPLVTS